VTSEIVGASPDQQPLRPIFTFYYGLHTEIAMAEKMKAAVVLNAKTVRGSIAGTRKDRQSASSHEGNRYRHGLPGCI
jgi:hypothetical protein